MLDRKVNIHVGLTFQSTQTRAIHPWAEMCKTTNFKTLLRFSLNTSICFWWNTRLKLTESLQPDIKKSTLTTKIWKENPFSQPTSLWGARFQSIMRSKDLVQGCA